MPKNYYAERIRWNYGGATVYLHRRKVMDRGKVLDPKWWRKKLIRKKSKRFEEQ